MMNYLKHMGTVLLFTGFLLKSTAQQPVSTDSLPYSEINIPIQINLKPVYAMAEKNVATSFSSPHWPNDWIEANCTTRFKYHFRRTPLNITAKGNSLSFGFTGLYQIIGSTRACVNGTALSPWTPPCSCGFSEGERKVAIGFTANFQLQPNYKLKATVSRTNPKPLNKCTVCFWHQDITGIIINNLKTQLDASAKTLTASLNSIDLLPYILSVWQKLNNTYSLAQLGWLQINPAQLHINSLYAKEDMLFLSLGITAKPVVRLEKPENKYAVLPNLTYSKKSPGFQVYLDAMLRYDSLTSLINQRLKEHRYDFKEGNLKKFVIVKNVQLMYKQDSSLKLSVDFEGSYKGTAVLMGKPAYDASSKTISINNLNFDLRSRNALLRTAKWLLNDLIIQELKTYTTINLSPYFQLAKEELNKELNKNWTKGLQTKGVIQDINLISVQPAANFLTIRSNGFGLLNMSVTDFSW